jgi:hypothetical protein
MRQVAKVLVAVLVIAFVVFVASLLRRTATRNENLAVSGGERARLQPEIPPTVMAEGLRRTVTRGESFPVSRGERGQLEHEVWTYYGDTIRRVQRLVRAID